MDSSPAPPAAGRLRISGRRGPWWSALVAVVLLVVVGIAGCGGDDGGASGDATTTTATSSDGDSDSGAADDPDSGDGDDVATGSDPTGDLADCPAGYDEPGPLEAGEHTGFASGDQDRAFHLLLPDDAADAPAPLFVSLTGTVQEEVDFMAQSQIDQLPGAGWIVVAPVRNGNGRVWGPWDAMRGTDDLAPNPDTTLILDLVACLAAHHPIDLDRVFAGGVSIGGTMVNFLLRHHPDVFAGGIVGSGNFILTEPADPQPLDDLTVVVAWGGDGDHWTGCPDGRMGEQYAEEPGCVSVSFVADAYDAATFYADEGARLLACHEDAGHIWLTTGTAWWAEILAASPRGTTDPLDPGDPPAPLECSTTPPDA